MIDNRVWCNCSSFTTMQTASKLLVVKKSQKYENQDFQVAIFVAFHSLYASIIGISNFVFSCKFMFQNKKFYNSLKTRLLLLSELQFIIYYFLINVSSLFRGKPF